MKFGGPPHGVSTLEARWTIKVLFGAVEAGVPRVESTTCRGVGGVLLLTDVGAGQVAGAAFVVDARIEEDYREAIRQTCQTIRIGDQFAAKK